MRQGVRPAADDGGPLCHGSAQSVGEAAGAWCAFDDEATMPGDQRVDDARCLCFDSPPLAAEQVILGAPVVELELAVDRRSAFVAARLCDVAPDGRSYRVTYGLLDLRHRQGHEQSVPLRPGVRERVRIELSHCAWAFALGHRLRLGLSTSYWPIAWPSPEPVTLSVWSAASRLLLPVRPPRAADAALRLLPEPSAAAAPGFHDLDPGGFRQRRGRDPATRVLLHELEVDRNRDGTPAMTHILPIDLEVGHGIVERLQIHDDDPLSARATIEHEVVLRREGLELRVLTRTSLSADAGEYRLDSEVEALENGCRVAARSFLERIPRQA
jgi:hypothetical protein